MTSFIKKGTIIYLYEIEDCHGQQLMDFDITLGKDILKSDDVHKYVNGNRVLINKAISEYMAKYYPEVHDYMYDYDEVK